MKKVILLALCLIMVISLCACGNDVDPNETNSTNNQQNETQGKAEENETIYAEDEFSFELVGYDATPSAYIVNIDFKFRNITDKNIDRIGFSAQGLDANGDVIEDTVMGEENISAGQATWFTYQTNSNRSCQTIDELSQKIHSIKVYSVQVHLDATDATTYYDLDFKEPIVIVVADVEDKEVVANQANNSNISNVLIASKWHRKDASGETVATMTFAEDNTGLMEMTDGESYDFKWSIGDNNTVDVVLIVDGRDAPGSYNFLNENGKYSIQMVDNSSFTYYAE